MYKLFIIEYKTNYNRIVLRKTNKKLSRLRKKYI